MFLCFFGNFQAHDISTFLISILFFVVFPKMFPWDPKTSSLPASVESAVLQLPNNFSERK